MSTRSMVAIVLAGTSLAMGCPAQAEPPVAVALVKSFGKYFLGNCGDVPPDSRGIRADACYAYIEFVDGKKHGPLSKTVSVPAGTHRLRLVCLYAYITPQDRGAVGDQRAVAVYDGSLAAPGTYFVFATIVHDICKVWISESPGGAPVASLTGLPND